MGRELREPPSDEGVLHDVADRLVRGRMGVAAGSAVVGFGAALGLSPWPATPLLVAAVVLAIVTLAFGIAARAVSRASAPARAVLLALLLASDAVVLVGAAALAGGRGPPLVFAVLLLVSSALHASALVRSAAPRGPRPLQRAADLDRATLAVLCDAVRGPAREAIGIVRARAEALRLAAEEAEVADLLGHDLDVLVRQAEECQRVLRALEQALEARMGGAARLPARPDRPEEAAPGARVHPWPSESTPLRS